MKSLNVLKRCMAWVIAGTHKLFFDEEDQIYNPPEVIGSIPCCFKYSSTWL
jgi:hypothetical protein